MFNFWPISGVLDADADADGRGDGLGGVDGRGMIFAVKGEA